MTFTRCSLAYRPTRPASSITPAGKFDRTAIMRKAVAMARQSRSSGISWRVLMRDCLRLAWSRAKAELALHITIEADRARRAASAPVWTPRPVVSRRWSRPLQISGTRAHSHAW